LLDLKLLDQAVTLATYRNFARAAAALHLTQPALSRRIAGLEAALGEKLVHRTPQGVEPPAFGELLLARGRVLLDGASELERDFGLMPELAAAEQAMNGIGVRRRTGRAASGATHRR
jgi:DNA-binding transcriptional LysR family regulator